IEIDFVDDILAGTGVVAVNYFLLRRWLDGERGGEAVDGAGVIGDHDRVIARVTHELAVHDKSVALRATDPVIVSEIGAAKKPLIPQRGIASSGDNKRGGRPRRSCLVGRLSGYSYADGLVLSVDLPGENILLVVGAPSGRGESKIGVRGAQIIEKIDRVSECGFARAHACLRKAHFQI